MATGHEPSEQARASIAAGLAALPELRPCWVRPCREQRPPRSASATGRPRLTLVVEGLRRVLAPIDGAVDERRLRPGDALVVAADGWSMPRGGTANRIIAVNCFDDGTRFEAPDGSSFHSGGPLNPAARSLFGALIQSGDDPQQRGLGADLLRLTIQAALADCRPWPEADGARLAWARARAHAHEHLDAGREGLAAAAGVHPNHLSRLCRRIEGVALLAWLTELRLERARALLSAGIGVEAVAHACGYADLSHFRRTFRARHGLPPGAWVVAAGRGAATVRP